MRSFLRTGKKGIIGALQGALFIRFLYLYMFREGSSRSCRSCSWRFIIDLDNINVGGGVSSRSNFIISTYSRVQVTCIREIIDELSEIS